MSAETVLNLSVIPKSSQSKISLDQDGKVKVYLNSPPEKGKANQECLKLLAKKLGISKSKITLIKGIKTRQKKILISGLKLDQVLELLRKD